MIYNEEILFKKRIKLERIYVFTKLLQQAITVIFDMFLKYPSLVVNNYIEPIR